MSQLTQAFTEIGEKYNHFTVTQIKPIHELNCVLYELKHDITGAEVMHIETDDPENVFSLSFKTFPSNSNGVAHILEHIVLCGSKKFPVKDPFFSMSRRSLNTFMNAFTGSDFTCYPAASQVEKDFYNLLEVYLDAVFHPELKKMSFLQEGHRLEFEDPEDPSSPLTIKGIVYNEMKGSLSSCDSRMWQTIMESILPDTPYAHRAGGDPKEIPSLTYEELLEFHRDFYHPSRCLFFFYGNFPLKKHLDFIEERVLKHTHSVASQPPKAPFQRRFDHPVYKTQYFPTHDTKNLENKNVLAFGWLTTAITDLEDCLAFSVLDYALMEMDASLLKMKLLKSGLCVQAEAVVYEIPQIPYVLVLRGCREEKLEEIEAFLFKSLEEIYVEGIPTHLIEAAIHNLEFHRTEISSESMPFGLTLFMRAALAKQAGDKPENALMVHSLFEILLKKTQDPNYLRGILRKYLLDNKHYCRILMKPSPSLAEEELEQEKIALKVLEESLTSDQKKKIVQEAIELEAYQENIEHQSLECLPKIDLKDIPLTPVEFPLVHSTLPKSQVYYHDCFTNHILYSSVYFTLPKLPLEDIPYLKLLTFLLTEVGNKKRAYAENLEYIHSHTGGVRSALELFSSTGNPQLVRPAIKIKGKALYRNASTLLSILADTASEVQFTEKERIKELILELHSSLQNRLSSNAINYATSLANSGFTVASLITEQCSGLNFYRLIHSLCENLDDNLDMIISKLNSLKERALCVGTPDIVVSCDHTMYEELSNHCFYSLNHLPQKPLIPWSNDYALEKPISQGYFIGSSVAFNARALPTIAYHHPLSPALNIAAAILKNKVLMPKIREQGGAYGTGASYSPMQGLLTFYSYRDPSLAKTLDIFDESLHIIANGGFDARDIEEAKIYIIQRFDTPTSPSHRAEVGYSWWIEGKSVDIRHRYRNALLQVHKEEVIEAAKLLIAANKNNVTVSFGNKELLEKENIILEKKGSALKLMSV